MPLGSVFQSLGVRLLVPLLLTVAAVLAVYAVFSFASTRDHFMSLVSAELQRSSDLIQRATHDGMLLNRLGEVQATVERLAAGPDLEAIRVYDKEGEVVISGDRAEVGSRIVLEDEPCLSCHSAGDPLSTARLEEIQLPSPGEGAGVLRHLTVIANEPSCAAVGCHAPVEEVHVLGVLDVEMSMAPVDAVVASARRHLVWTTLIMAVVGGLVAAVFIRRMVHRPLLELYLGTERIASGDLSTRIDVRGRSELARLGGAFNRMAADLAVAEEELREWSQRLERKIVEKTEELRRAQHQVLHMEKMASLGKLSATVAHELNNPLSGVLTYARLVERELGDQSLPPELAGELRRYLGLIQKECSRCGDIVKNLLLFARTRGAQFARVDLNEIVDRALMLVRHHLEIGGVQVRFERMQGDTSILADGGQLQQALLALFVNASEAMRAQGDEGGELSVLVDGDEEEVQIVVGDTGVGIAPDVLPQIFEPFFSTKDEESGVGLGLAVVYGILKRHGGSIDVDSEPGRGTTFKLRLPRRPPLTTESWKAPTS